MRIEGASALVAGGASGLGAATARRLRAGGADVTIADLNADAGEALAAEIGARFVACDVTDAAQVEAAVAAAEGLRISVCCAGIGHAEKAAGKRGAHALEPFKRVIAVNLIGTFNVLRLAAAAMLANEPDEGGECGVIVNTASIAAYDGQIGQIAYSASKGGVVGMTLPAARDLAAARVRVCTIAPACSTRRCWRASRRRPARRSAPRSRTPRAWARRTSTALSPCTSSRTRCSTAR
jgi:3-hydroxyacyl-CoA dehydrogenase/3-hydroxy-2-methylbutyryl-CoA dehydrogenase